MTEFMRAHGYVPGPTQRPLVTGVLSAAAGAGASLPLLAWTGGIDALARSLGVGCAAAAGGFAGVMVLGGLAYARVFMRAANDERGGWLFGICFGFLLWLLGPATLLLWLRGQPLATGVASQGIFGGHLLYGVVMGAVFPWAHRVTRGRLAKGMPNVPPGK